MFLQELLSSNYQKEKRGLCFSVSGCAKAWSSLLPVLEIYQEAEVEKVYIDYIWSEETLIIVYPSK